METVVAGAVLAVVLIGSGYGIWRIARNAGTGGLSRNAVAGIRTKATMASDEAWTAAHVRAERPTAIGGMICAAAGVIALLVSVLLLVGALDESTGNPILLGVVVVGTVGLLGFGGWGCVVGNRAAQEALDL